MTKKHALLSASGAERWLACTPSARLETKVPDYSNDSAKEGTEAHSIAELVTRYWLNEISEQDYENTLAKYKKSMRFYTDEMLKHATDYARFIMKKIEELSVYCPNAQLELEAKVDFSKWVRGGFGTSDCIIVADGWLEVIDYKYGLHNRVSAEDNVQMKLYALGAVTKYDHLFDIENIRMTIVQPRLPGWMCSDKISYKDLITWAETYVKPRAELAYYGKGEFAPGEVTCRWCRIKKDCRARTEYNNAQFDGAPDLLLITPEEAGAILERAADIRSWLCDLESLVTAELYKGADVEGWKLIASRGNRKFADETQVVEKLMAAGYDESTFYERKLISPTQMEKQFGKKEIAETLTGLIVKPEGKLVLAPVSDRNPQVFPESTILADFDD